MRNIFFIALHDIRHQMRQGATLLWVFVMPPIFFFFIGTVTGGFSSGTSGTGTTPIVVVADAPGFVQNQIDLRLRDNNFSPEWREQTTDSSMEGQELDRPPRVLTFSNQISDLLLAGKKVSASYATAASSLTRDYESIRIQRALYTVLADVAVAKAQSGNTLSAQSLETVNATPRIWQLEVSPAGKRLEIPSGFEQTVPGILVMFTLLVLLTSGATMLTTERIQGLLRRLASAPISRSEIVAGKWGGRMVLAAAQIGIAILFGTLLFKMNWGPDLVMVLVVLGAWAAFCASAGLLLGSVAGTEGQAAGLGVLCANLFAALGGCWWPIEITPDWMQFLQKLLPTGWTMDALHKLISFEAGALSVLPNIVALLVASIIVGVFAIRRFRYD